MFDLLEEFSRDAYSDVLEEFSAPSTNTVAERVARGESVDDIALDLGLRPLAVVALATGTRKDAVRRNVALVEERARTGAAYWVLAARYGVEPSWAKRLCYNTAGHDGTNYFARTDREVRWSRCKTIPNFANHNIRSVALGSVRAHTDDTASGCGSSLSLFEEDAL